MADVTTPTGNSAALQPDAGVPIPRIKMAEIGFAALKSRSGKMYEEANRAFTYPNMLKVVDEMRYSPPVAIGLQAINILMNRSEIYAEPVVGETPVEKERRDYLESVFHDMDDSWQTTMQHISTYKEYGHSLAEIVYRRRLFANGSSFNDGRIGLKGLKYRPQNSIVKWNFDETGRTLVSVSQSIANVENSARFGNLKDDNGFIVIPIEKLLLFRADPTSDNPEGNSILKSIFLSFRQLSLLSDHLMLGISKDIANLPLIRMPIQYMSPDASDADKAVFTNMQTIANAIAAGTETAVILPSLIDPDSKADMFNISLLEPKAGAGFDIPAIMEMLQANILSVLSCDSVTMGINGGSLSTQDSTTSMLAMQVDYRLSEISNTLNQTLVPLLYRANGWDTSRLPKLKFKDVSSTSMDEFSSYFQRVAAVGGIEYTRDVMNKVREVGGFDLLPDDMPVNLEILSTAITGKSSNSGDGLAVGVNGGGTAKSPQARDDSIANKENAA